MRELSSPPPQPQEALSTLPEASREDEVNEWQQAQRRAMIELDNLENFVLIELAHGAAQIEQSQGYYKPECEEVLREPEVRKIAERLVLNESTEFYRDISHAWLEKAIQNVETSEATPDQKAAQLDTQVNAFKQGLNEYRPTADLFNFSRFKNASPEELPGLIQEVRAYSEGRILTSALQGIQDVKDRDPHLLDGQLDLQTFLTMMEDDKYKHLFSLKPKQAGQPDTNTLITGLETLDRNDNHGPILTADSVLNASPSDYQTKFKQYEQDKTNAFQNQRYYTTRDHLPLLNRFRVSLKAVRNLDRKYVATHGYGRGGFALSTTDERTRKWGFRPSQRYDETTGQFAPYGPTAYTTEEGARIVAKQREYQQLYEARLQAQQQYHQEIQNRLHPPQAVTIEESRPAEPVTPTPARQPEQSSAKRQSMKSEPTKQKRWPFGKKK